jgi:hypothetical protein
MDLEQIVKETVAKIVAEKQGKDLTGDGKIDSADYLKARSNAIEKAKGLDEASNKIYITHKGPSDNPASNYIQYDLTFNGDEINAEEYEKGWKVIRYDDWEDEWKDVRNPKKQEIINFINAYNEKSLDNIKEEKDHEVSMAQSSLNSILRSAMELKAKIGNQEIDIPAWIQDHITNSETYIDQASQGYHEYSNGGHEGEEMNEARVSQDNVVDYLANALQNVWSAGKGNNSIDFQDFAQSLYFDMFGGDEMNEGYNSEQSAIESASGDKITGTEEDDYGTTLYIGQDPYDQYFIVNGEIKHDNFQKGIKSVTIGMLKHYGDGQNHSADDDMYESEKLNKNTMTTNEGRSAEDLKQGQLDQAYDHLEKIKEKPKLFSSEDIKKAEARIEKLEAELDALAAKATNESLDEATVRRWQHYAGIK